MICRAGTSLGFGEHPPDQAEDGGGPSEGGGFGGGDLWPQF